MAQRVVERLFWDVHPTRFEGAVQVYLGIMYCILAVPYYFRQELTVWVAGVWFLAAFWFLFEGEKKLSRDDLDPEAEYDWKDSVAFVGLVLTVPLLLFYLQLVL
jgi:hypothetical protein